MTFERYAIYWAPRPASPIARFGREWLGGDPETGAPCERRGALWLDADLVEKATASPRLYGLHATIKAPFRLAAGTSQAELSEAIAGFCEYRRPVRSGPLKLHRFARFLALVPASSRAGIEWLENECVTHFDRFRAPLSDADRARRSGAMSPLEERHFEQFGYPYIFSRFFFHITLAGPLGEDELAQVEAALAPAVAPFTQEEFVIEDLSLAGDPGGGSKFQIVARHPFSS
jgi:hypothetical protein